MITADELPKLVRNSNTPLNKVFPLFYWVQSYTKLSIYPKIYILHATQDTYLFNKSTGEPATRKQYYADPSQYESKFHELVRNQ